jgi:hypothetical protein
MDANSMGQAFNQKFEAARLGNMTFNDREIEFFINSAQLELVKERYAKWKNTPQIGFGQHPIRNSELAGLITATSSVSRDKFILGTKDNGALRGPDLDKGGITQEEDKWGIFVGLPNEMIYPILERVNTTKGSITKEGIEVKEVSLPEYAKDIYNSFAKPSDNLVWSLDWGTYTPSAFNTGTYSNSSKDVTTGGPLSYNMKGLNYLGLSIDINTNRSKYLIPGKGWKIMQYVVHYIKLPKDIHIDTVTPSLQENCELAEFLHQEIIDKAVKLAAASIAPNESKYQVNTIESKSDE